MPHTPNHFVNTPVGPTPAPRSRRPAPSFTTGINELVSGVTNLRKGFRADVESRAGQPPIGAMESILSGRGLTGTVKQPTIPPEAQFRGESGSNVQTGAAPLTGSARFSSAGATNPEQPMNVAGNKPTSAYLLSEEAARDAVVEAKTNQRFGEDKYPTHPASTSPHGFMRRGGDQPFRFDPDPNRADEMNRLQSPEYLRYLKQQGAERLPEGVNFSAETGFTSGGGYGSGKTPQSAQYDRAGEAELIRGRRADTAAFIESRGGGAEGRRETNLRRKANARLSGNMGIVSFVTAAANRKNARDELTQLTTEKGRDRRAFLAADTSRANVRDQQSGALDRTLIGERGDTNRAVYKAEQTERLESFKQGKLDARNLFSEAAKTNRELLKQEFTALKEVAGSRRKLITRVAEQHDSNEADLISYIVDGVRPGINQQRAEQNKAPLGTDPGLWNDGDLALALSSAGPFLARQASSRTFFGDPAIDAVDARREAGSNYFSSRRRNDNSKD